VDFSLCAFSHPTVARSLKLGMFVDYCGGLMPVLLGLEGHRRG